MAIAILLVGGSMVMGSEISVGELTSFLLYTGYVGASVGGLTSFYSEIQKGMGATYRIFELMEKKPLIPLSGLPFSVKVMKSDKRLGQRSLRNIFLLSLLLLRLKRWPCS